VTIAVASEEHGRTMAEDAIQVRQAVLLAMPVDDWHWEQEAYP
jgi:hypothetical protein